MFGRKKMLEQLKLESEKIEKEKNELLFIKKQLEETNNKIDISNVYIWEIDGIYNIVKLHVSNIEGKTFFGAGKLTKGYKSTLVDIFTNETIYEKCSTAKLEDYEYMRKQDGRLIKAHFIPILYIERDLLVYTDKQVPLYVLKQLYYKLNRVDINNPILQRKDKK